MRNLIALITLATFGWTNYYCIASTIDSENLKQTGSSPSDSCSAAPNVTSVPFEAPSTDTSSATTGSGDPIQSCGAGTQNSNSVWYSFTAPCEGELTVDTCGSSYDTVLAVYSGSCGALTELSCNDDDCSLQSSIEGISLDEDTTVYIEVAQYDTDGGGTLEFSLDMECDGPPATPSNPYPADEAEDVALNPTLSWNNASSQTSRVIPKVIYGDDDRLDEYQVTDNNTLTLGDSVVILVSRHDITDNGNGTYTLSSTTFGEYSDLCSDEPFRNQPGPGFCTGFLADNQVIGTAGHCVTTEAECQDAAIVFGFVMLDATSAAITLDESEVYFCDSIIDREESSSDWGLLQLDRAVTNHDPLAYRTSGKIPDNEPLLVIGHPAGIPRKYAAGANVRSNTSSVEFTANLDVYGGNSGSPVFSTNTGLVEGVLIGGEEDFEYRPPPYDCWVSNECSDSGCTGESVTRSTVFASLPTSSEFDVYFGECPSLDLVDTVTDTSWQAPVLDIDTEYCWQIVARNDEGESSGPQWIFTTTTEDVIITLDPTSLDFGPDDTALAIDIWNDGNDDASWTITEDEDWLSVSSTSVSSSGPDDVASVTVTVDRDNLDPGTYQGTILIGTTQVAVSMSVLDNLRPTCTPSSLDFGTGTTTLTFETYNAGDDVWNFTITSSEPWISTSPTTGTSVGPADRTEVTVTVDRTGLSAGSHTGTIDLDGATVAVELTIPGSGGCGATGFIGIIGCAGALLLLRCFSDTHRSF